MEKHQEKLVRLRVFVFFQLQEVCEVSREGNLGQVLGDQGFVLCEGELLRTVHVRSEQVIQFGDHLVEAGVLADIDLLEPILHVQMQLLGVHKQQLQVVNAHHVASDHLHLRHFVQLAQVDIHQSSPKDKYLAGHRLNKVVEFSHIEPGHFFLRQLEHNHGVLENHPGRLKENIFHLLLTLH
jgi:hypothetical protein